MRLRLLTTCLLGAALMGCSGSSSEDISPVSESEPNDTVSALQKAASDALTPRAQRKSYLTSDPAKGD